MNHLCLAIGVATQNSNGDLLETFFPAPLFQPDNSCFRASCEVVDASPDSNNSVVLDSAQLATLAEQWSESWSNGASTARSILQQGLPPHTTAVLVLLHEDLAPQSVPEAYLKLHLLSLRHCRPHQLNLDGIFALLPNNVWTSEGAIDPAELEQRQLAARLAGRQLSVDSVDKFPRMANYVAPAGVRIADTSRVRLGAYLGAGTTVMHEGFVNFNAGTEGPGMIEGRISAGVFVGRGSDLGGGCSTMGTLSGGNSVIISVGEECLIGANAGLGIPLGDRCTIEAGLYVTGGSVVTLLDENGSEVRTCKARELAGHSDLLFRRNSMTGRMECKTNRAAIALNEELHANN